MTADCEHSLAQKLLRKSKVHYYRSAAFLLVGLSILVCAVLSASPRKRGDTEKAHDLKLNPPVFETQIFRMQSEADRLEQADWEAMAQYGTVAEIDSPVFLDIDTSPWDE